MRERLEADVVIVGSGPGGATTAHALRDSGLSVLLLERGGFLPREPENQSIDAVFRQRRYVSEETWLDRDGVPFAPDVHYFVGGASKLFGACMARLRESDFEEYELEDGPSPRWPVSYAELEPYYAEAERIYGVHGVAGEDPLEPPRSGAYPAGPVPDDPVIGRLRRRLEAQGLHPYTLPLGIDRGDGGRCVLSRQCDAFACPWDAKSDADVRCVRPALRSPNVRLLTGARVTRLVCDVSGRRVTRLEAELQGRRVEVECGSVVLAAGAINSAALLLRSADRHHPRGLANASGQVGRNYMAHVNVAALAIDPRATGTPHFQKTLGVGDFYDGDPDSPNWRFPLGSMQLVGKVQAGMVRAERPYVPRRLAEAITRRSVDWWLFTEDCPLPENRVTIAPSGLIQLSWRSTNSGSRERLIRHLRTMMRRAGYPIVFVKRWGLATVSHQSGTLVMGDDPDASVVDALGRAHDVENLFVSDASVFPSVGAGPGGPTLTIAALALRTAAGLTGDETLRRWPRARETEEDRP